MSTQNPSATVHLKADDEAHTIAHKLEQEHSFSLLYFVSNLIHL
jgi:hypothetical protein